MEFLVFAVGVVAVLLLGLAAGALLAEACVLVPMWQSQEPASFLAWYKQHAGLLLRFFGAIEVASTVAIIAATGLAYYSGLSGANFYGASTALNLAVLGCFPVYFKAVNASFADGTIPVSEVPTELTRWSRWHWARTGLAIAAFILAVLGLEI